MHEDTLKGARTKAFVLQVEKNGCKDIWKEMGCIQQVHKGNYVYYANILNCDLCILDLLGQTKQEYSKLYLVIYYC